MLLRIAFLGFGNVGQALAALLQHKMPTLETQHNLQVQIVGVATGSHGLAINPAGLDTTDLLSIADSGGSYDVLHQGQPISSDDVPMFLARVPADLLFESIPTSPHDGQPAYAFDYGALERGLHVVTANKGPVAFGYRDLTALARRKGVGFFFESTLMDGAPVLATGREGLPGSEIKRIRGIFNSTTNYILTRMEAEDLTFDEALSAAQAIGIAETDPSLDIDGWDSAIKTVIAANVLMGADLRPSDVKREGIRGVTRHRIRELASNGQRLRLMCYAERDADGQVTARVQPEPVPADGELAAVQGTTSIVDFETDTLRRLSIVEHDPGPDTTAYGMFADMLNILRGRYRTAFTKE
ncbi:MAG: homoserine dehydrogenase [Chloroflexi bacterium]|nr:homoserine dehydrogenase [Chloroflexota bacterium]